jgi:protein-disulfide isomerase
MLENDKLQAVKDSSYIKGNKDAKITWIEYSDLECPYCAKLHNAGTVEALTEKYGDKLNIMYNHFPLDFHKNAQT